MADSQSLSLIILERDSVMQADCGYEADTEMLKLCWKKSHDIYL
jgi:hypothetical protein